MESPIKDSEFRTLTPFGLYNIIKWSYRGQPAVTNIVLGTRWPNGPPTQQSFITYATEMTELVSMMALELANFSPGLPQHPGT